MCRAPAAFLRAQPPRPTRFRGASRADGIPLCLAQEARKASGRFPHPPIPFTPHLRGTGGLEDVLRAREIPPRAAREARETPGSVP